MILIYSKHNVQMSILFKGNEWLLNKGDQYYKYDYGYSLKNIGKW